MIKPNEYITLHRNGHLAYVGKTMYVLNDKVVAEYSENGGYTCEINPVNGLTEKYGYYYHAKVVTKEEWDSAVKKLGCEYYVEGLALREKNRAEEERFLFLKEAAEKWYYALPEKERELADALMWNWRPVAVA